MRDAGCASAEEIGPGTGLERRRASRRGSPSRAGHWSSGAKARRRAVQPFGTPSPLLKPPLDACPIGGRVRARLHGSHTRNARRKGADTWSSRSAERQAIFFGSTERPSPRPRRPASRRALRVSGPIRRRPVFERTDAPQVPSPVVDSHLHARSAPPRPCLPAPRDDVHAQRAVLELRHDRARRRRLRPHRQRAGHDLLFLATTFLPAFVAPALTARLDQLPVRRALPGLYLARPRSSPRSPPCPAAPPLPVLIVLALADGAVAIVGRALTRAAVAAALEPTGRSTRATSC